MTYDERTCITVGEMRRLGFDGLPEDIPDCAWAPRAAMDMKPGKVEMGEDGVIHCRVSVTFSVPLRWYEATFERQLRVL